MRRSSSGDNALSMNPSPSQSNLAFDSLAGGGVRAVP